MYINLQRSTMFFACASSLSVVLLTCSPTPAYASCLADARTWFYVAKFSQAWRHRRPWHSPNDNCYISNGRRFAKSVFLRILLLSTSRVSSMINYFLASSLPIHTRNSANAEHTVSWNRVKCCTNVQRIAFEKSPQPVNDLQLSHSRSLPLLPFDRPCTIS